MPRDRIELSTPGFSDQCSTTELPRHYIYIVPNFYFTRKRQSFPLPFVKTYSLFNRIKAGLQRFFIEFQHFRFSTFVYFLHGVGHTIQRYGPRHFYKCS